jgi:hypothetical protein
MEPNEKLTSACLKRKPVMSPQNRLEQIRSQLENLEKYMKTSIHASPGVIRSNARLAWRACEDAQAELELIKASMEKVHEAMRGVE